MIDEKKLAEEIVDYFEDKAMTRQAWDVLNILLDLIANANSQPKEERDEQLLRIYRILEECNQAHRVRDLE